MNKEKALEVEMLLEIGKLKDNWDGYGASAIPSEVVNKSIEILMMLKKKPAIFPTGRESIQFEWEGKNGYIEIEVFSERIEIFLVDENEKEREMVVKEEIWKILKEIEPLVENIKE